MAPAQLLYDAYMLPDGSGPRPGLTPEEARAILLLLERGGVGDSGLAKELRFLAVAGYPLPTGPWTIQVSEPPRLASPDLPARMRELLTRAESLARELRGWVSDFSMSPEDERARILFTERLRRAKAFIAGTGVVDDAEDFPGVEHIEGPWWNVRERLMGYTDRTPGVVIGHPRGFVIERLANQLGPGSRVEITSASPDQVPQLSQLS